MSPNITILPELEDGLVRVETELDGLHSVSADILPCDEDGDPAVVYVWFHGTDICTILSDDALNDCLDAYADQVEDADDEEPSEDDEDDKS
jgi:hypothetical protein